MYMYTRGHSLPTLGVHELDPDDGFDDVGDDVMKKEHTAGDEGGHKCDEIAMDTGVHKDLGRGYTQCYIQELKLYFFWLTFK